MITLADCVKQIDKYSVELPDEIMMEMYVEQANGYALTYTDATNKALRVLVVCFLVLSSGVRELASRGADGASQSFKNKDSLKQLKKLINSMDKDKIIDDLPSTATSSGIFFTVRGSK